MSTPSRALRVAAFPAFRNRERLPYNGLLYDAIGTLGVAVEELTGLRLLLRRYDVVHLHWPERVLDPPSPVRAAIYTAALLTLLRIARLRGARVVWTVHNLGAHDRKHPRLEARLWRGFVPLVEGVIGLSAHGLALAGERYPPLAGLPAAVVPQGSYRAAYPPAVPRAAARRELALPAEGPCLLFLGQLRAYKGLPELLTAFRGVGDPAAHLLIAGAPKDAALVGELEALAARDHRVDLRAAFVPAADIPALLGAADLVVLPYRNVLNSAAAILALDFDRPVLVPRQGAMAELAATAGSAWVQTFAGELTAEVLREALEWATAPGRPEMAPPQPSWPELAAKTVSFYRELGAPRRSSSSRARA